MKENTSTKKKNTKLVPVLLLLGVILSICLALWPQFIYHYASIFQGMTISSYQDALDSFDEEKIQNALDNARAYNEKIYKKQKDGSIVSMQDTLNDFEYSNILNLTGDGVMGYIEIPSINVELPIGHGTSDKVLEVGAGHLYGSSVPVGGENTHSVITAHTGLRSAKMFTDVDKLKTGDTFSIHVLNEVIEYEVDQIKVVLPEDANPYLAIHDGKDEVTLYTCTPYGINTHRLLVRGHSIGKKTVKGLVDDNATIKKLNRRNLVITILIAAIPIVVFIIGMIRIFRKPKKKG